MRAPDVNDVLLVVDVQRDFCPGGALAVPEGDAVIPVINALLPRFRRVVFSRDWHPADHVSFAEEPSFGDLSWPPHCVQDTPGACFHPDLLVPEKSLIVSKATMVDQESYSAFSGTGLAERLRGVNRLFVTGLATEYCVKATVLDGVRQGFAVLVITDAIRGINTPPGASEAALDAMREAGAIVVNAGELAQS